jgi:hypothetical protein
MRDPLLAIMPTFVFSMPAQIVVDGINISLVSTLAIQLIFTAQYHYPLSRKNYLLQLVSVLMLLITVAVHLHVVLAKLKQESHVWPYMFPYIGVEIPPQDGSWTMVQEAFYLLVRAVSTSLVHVSLHSLRSILPNRSDLLTSPLSVPSLVSLPTSNFLLCSFPLPWKLASSSGCLDLSLLSQVEWSSHLYLPKTMSRLPI